jgi:hypothetical protein
VVGGEINGIVLLVEMSFKPDPFDIKIIHFRCSCSSKYETRVVYGYNNLDVDNHGPTRVVVVVLEAVTVLPKRKKRKGDAGCMN